MTAVVLAIEPIFLALVKTHPSTTTSIAVEVLTQETVCHLPSLIVRPRASPA